MARGVEATIQVDGGKQVPVSVVEEAVRMLRNGKPVPEVAAAMASRERQAASAGVEGIAEDRLRSLVERIERLQEERKALGSDITDIFSEAKWAGFDVKVLRQLIRIRAMDPAEVEEQETLLDVYRRALGA